MARTMSTATDHVPDPGQNLAARLEEDLAALDRELAEIGMLAGQVKAEAARHEQKRAQAAERVAGEGIDCEVIDLRTLRPLDREALLSSVRKTGKCLIAYEDNKFGGDGAEIAAIVAEEAFDYLDGPVTRIAGPDVPAMPYNHVLEDWFMLNPARIAAAIRRLAAY